MSFCLLVLYNPYFTYSFCLFFLTAFPLKNSQFSRENLMAKKTGLFDLETHFSFYGAYHSNPVNILIHTLFVWPIFFTSLMLFSFTPAIYDISQIGFLNHGLALNFGFFFALLYALFYVSLDKRAGSLAALLCLACWVGASFVAGRLGFSVAWKVSFDRVFYGLFDC